MKRALLTSGDHEGDETVLTMDLEELEFLVFAVNEARASVTAPGSISDRVFGCLTRALRDMRAGYAHG